MLDSFLPTVDRKVVAESNRPRRRAGYIEDVTVVHFVEFIFRLDVTQLGIGQHGRVSSRKHHTPPSSHQTNKNIINQ